jgi:hypothetical protein
MGGRRLAASRLECFPRKATRARDPNNLKKRQLEIPCERRFAASTIECLRFMRFIAKSGSHLFTTTYWARA